MPRAGNAKAGHDVSEPYRARAAPSVFGNLMVEEVINDDSITTMVFAHRGGPLVV